MGGVDLVSLAVISYNSQYRGVRWRRKIAEPFIGVSVYDSFIYTVKKIKFQLKNELLIE